MGDIIIVDGDIVTFNAAFGIATITPIPGTMSGSGDATVGGSAVCLEGDEGNVSVTTAYLTSSHSVPGAGTLTIDSLGSDQLSSTTKNGSKLILKGSTFNAKFEVSAPAQTTSSPPVTDTTTSYTGTGSFTSMNTTVKAD